VTASDCLVDLLMWVDYAERVRMGGAVIVLAVPIAGGLLHAPTRLTRSQLDRWVTDPRTCLIDPTSRRRGCAPTGV
jgi:hypothetical protein